MNTEMSVNEAIKRIQDHMRVHKMSEPRAHYINTAFEMAIAALERISAKSVIVMTRDEEGDEYEFIHCVCPNCKNIIDQRRKGQKTGFYTPKYHQDCGQRLDWANVASEEDKPEQIGEENQQLHDEINLLTIYDNWRKRHDPAVLDWMNFGQEKWSIRYKHDLRTIACNWAVRYQNIGALYFSTESLAEQFYTEHKDLIHRVLMVK